MRAAGVVAHLLHGGFGGQAAADRIGDARYPAAIGGEHAIGFDHFVMLASAELAARRRPARRSPRASPRRLCAGAPARHRHPRRRPGGSRPAARAARAGPIARPALRRTPTSLHRQHAAAVALRHFERVDEFAARGQLGDDHRDRLQNLDLVLGVMRATSGSARQGRREPGRRAGSAHPSASDRSPRRSPGR